MGAVDRFLITDIVYFINNREELRLLSRNRGVRSVCVNDSCAPPCQPAIEGNGSRYLDTCPATPAGGTAPGGAGPPRPGRSRWTLELLCERLVRDGVVFGQNLAAFLSMFSQWIFPDNCVIIFAVEAPCKSFCHIQKENKNKMNKSFNKFIVVLLVASLFVFPMAGVKGGVQAQGSFPPALEPSLSADGLTLYNGVAPLVVVVDPNPAMQGIQVPTEPAVAAAIADPDATSAAFSFTYVAAGGTDPWGKTCQDFPAAAETAFNAAAAIWTSTIQSSVPITISACWSNLGSSSILGYSGGAPLRRDFTGAPKPNTWYEGSLANALHGSDLDPSAYDDYITYNSGFSWYFGTDGHPTAGTYDLVTVAAHEIAHGLNFSGSADYSGGMGSYGYDTGYPNVYDTFIESVGGAKLTSYTNPSTDLGTLLTSDSLWFNGTNANAANGGSRVKIYAPSSWAGGSSYSHLDYSTFAGTANSMMVYAVSSASAQHNPGPVTKGLLKDLGWVLAGGSTVSTIYLPLVLRITAGTPPGAFNKSAPGNGATGQPANPTLSWGASSTATSYEYCIDTSNNSACDASWISTGATTSVGLSSLIPATSYYWQVRANNASGTTNANGGTWWSFTIAGSTGPTAGFWESATGDEFYVTPDQADVNNFAIYVYACYINYKIIHNTIVPIVGNQFSFDGALSASGTFDSSTSAHGTDQLISYYLPGCGTASGGPWPWTATWQNSSQPTIVIEGDTRSVILIPALQMPHYYHTITIKQ